MRRLGSFLLERIANIAVETLIIVLVFIIINITGFRSFDLKSIVFVNIGNILNIPYAGWGLVIASLFTEYPHKLLLVGVVILGTALATLLFTIARFLTREIIFKGNTQFKRRFGLQILTEDGQEPTRKQLIKRNLLRDILLFTLPIFILPIFILPIFGGRGLHEVLTKTYTERITE